MLPKFDDEHNAGAINKTSKNDIDGLVQDRSHSTALAMFSHRYDQ